MITISSSSSSSSSDNISEDFGELGPLGACVLRWSRECLGDHRKGTPGIGICQYVF